MKRVLWGSAAALLGSVGCTTIFGSYEVGTGGASTTGGAGGATTTHATGGSASGSSGTTQSSSGTSTSGHTSSSGATSSGTSGTTSGGTGGTTTTTGTCTGTTAPGTAMGVVAGMVPGPGTFVGGCQIFPTDNAWNVDVSSTSIATTATYTGIPQGTHLHPDLGGWTGTAYGIPYNVVPSGQADVSITFNQYGSESDPGPGGWTTNPSGGGNGVTAYPIPNNPKIEGDPGAGQIAGDDHLLVVQQGATCGTCTLYETWQTTGGTAPPWTAANGAVWNLGSNALRPLGWTSADAAGLSVFAGLLKIAEVKAGVVTHAVRVTFGTTQAGYVYPATHYAGSGALGGSDPPMGLHLRMKASVDTSSFSGPGKIVSQGMKTYGLIIGDIGSDWYFQGDSDDGWNDKDPNGTDTYIGELLTDFGKVTGADFEVLDTGAPMNTGE
jgi:hypothetical protein